MSIGNSGLFLPTIRDALFNLTALDLDAETHKGALFSNSVTTPNFGTNTAYGAAPFNANEVSGTGWAAGGVVLTGTLLDLSTIAGTLVYDATDVSVAGTTLTNARGYLLYADAITTPTADPAIVLVSFGADFSTVNGTFGIQWAAPASGGVFNIDLTP